MKPQTENEICANCGQIKENHPVLYELGGKGGVLSKCKKFTPKNQTDKLVENLVNKWEEFEKPQNQSPRVTNNKGDLVVPSPLSDTQNQSRQTNKGCGKWFKSFEQGRVGITTYCGFQYRRNTRRHLCPECKDKTPDTNIQSQRSRQVSTPFTGNPGSNPGSGTPRGIQNQQGCGYKSTLLVPPQECGKGGWLCSECETKMRGIPLSDSCWKKLGIKINLKTFDSVPFKKGEKNDK